MFVSEFVMIHFHFKSYIPLKVLRENLYKYHIYQVNLQMNRAFLQHQCLINRTCRHNISLRVYLLLRANARRVIGTQIYQTSKFCLSSKVFIVLFKRILIIPPISYLFYILYSKSFMK